MCINLCFKASAYLVTNQVKHSNSERNLDENYLPVEKGFTIVKNHTVKMKQKKKQKGINSVQKSTTLSTSEKKTKACKSFMIFI